MLDQKQRQHLALLVFAACLSPGAALADSTPTKLAISYSQKTPDFLAPLMANDAGYFKKRGLDVTVTYLPSEEGVPALITGQQQFAAIGGSDASSAEAQGTKLKLLATFTPTYIFQFWAQPQYKTADALKGQRIGITSTTGSLYSATLLSLDKLGLKPTDVKLTPLGSVVNVNASLLAGSVAAASSHPPATYKIKQAGLVDLVDLARKKVPSVSAGIWVTEAYLKDHHDLVQKVIDALVEASHREKTDRAFTESEITKYFGVKDQGELDFTYDFYVNEVLAPEPIPELTQLNSDIKTMSATNPKVKNINAADMIDTSFVNQAVKDLAAQKSTK